MRNISNQRTSKGYKCAILQRNGQTQMRETFPHKKLMFLRELYTLLSNHLYIFYLELFTMI